MNRTVNLIFCCVVLFLHFNSTSLAQEPNWLKSLKSIRPLIDNREIVRKLYGNPFSSEKNRDFFHLKEGKLVATYSLGKCSSQDLHGKWFVNEDTLIELDFDVEEKINFSARIFGLKGFKLETPDDMPQMKIYTNKNLGIEYISSLNYLSDIRIFPSTAQSSLMCKE